jgi:hypothetical protein
VLSTTTATQPGGGTVINLTGHYQTRGNTINLRASTVKSGFHIRATGPPSESPSTAEEGYQPDADYYYSNNEMTKSDGTVMVEAVYEYEQPTNRSMLYITLGGVTLNFDLNTQQAGELSDADQQRLDAWAASEDASLVEDTSVALINNGSQQSNSEVLLNYYAVAMFVDNIPPPPETAAARINAPRKTRTALHHAVRNLIPRAAKPTGSSYCWKDVMTPLTSNSNGLRSMGLLAISSPSGCFGCCGLGCACITTRFGVPIYGTPCANHDRCVGQYGYSSRQCFGQFVVAVVYTWYRWDR